MVCVFECIPVYSGELDSACELSRIPARQPNIKITIITNLAMLGTVLKCIRVSICNLQPVQGLQIYHLSYHLYVSQLQ